MSNRNLYTPEEIEDQIKANALTLAKALVSGKRIELLQNSEGLKALEIKRSVVVK